MGFRRGVFKGNSEIQERGYLGVLEVGVKDGTGGGDERWLQGIRAVDG